MRPLSQHKKHAPLSSTIISFSRYRVKSDTIVPPPLPEEYCARLFAADGVAALSTAASVGALELIDHLLPLQVAYLPSLDFPNTLTSPVTRELMVDLRARLSASLGEDEDPGFASQADVESAVHVIDRRVRSSDIYLTFHMAGIHNLEAVFARAQTGPAFDWLYPNEEYTSMEQDDLNRALQVTVTAGRVDLTEWLIEWGAELDSRPYGQALAEHTIFERIYDFEFNGQRRVVQDDHRNGQRRWERVLTRWERHQPPTNHLHSVLSTLPPTTCINSAALSALIAADLAEGSGTGRGYRGRELLKRGQLLTESSAPGHPAMLTFLADRLGGDGLPRLSVIVAGGAIWALEWLLNSGRITLGMVLRDVNADLTVGLAEQVWLTPNLTVGLVLASLCVSHGAIAMLEMLNFRGINLRAVYGGLTLMHIAAREMQAVSVFWLVENGYEDLVLQRTPDGTTPLHEAVKAGDTFIMNYLLKHGSAAADRATGPKWDALAISSQHIGVQEIGREFRSRQALETTLPEMLRSNALLTDLQAIVHGHAFARSVQLSFPRLRAVLQAAIEGGRHDFLRWIYTCPDVFGADFRDSACEEDLDDDPYVRNYTHDELCRELAESHGGAQLSTLVALFDELATASDNIRRSKSELHDLDQQIEEMFLQGGTVAEIEARVSKVRHLFAAAPSLDVGEHRTMAHGLSLRINSSHERFTVKVGDIGNFEVLPACALLAHVHLVEWLLRDVDEPATVEQAADALAISLQWWGPTSVVQLLCRHLQESDFDLNAVQLATDPEYPDHGRERAGAMEFAVYGITHSALSYARHVAGLRPTLSEVEAEEAQTREQLGWANATWLASHTGARLDSNSFPKILGSHHFSYLGMGTDAINSAEVQSAVLQLTQVCIRQLGASWSDSSKHGRDERELTALQLLVNGCWMDAVQWLAKECNAPLQGLVIEGEDHYYTRGSIEPFHATLRTLQEEQQRAWAGMGGDVADTE